MKIDCYLSSRCGSESALRDHLSEALGLESIEAEVSVQRTDDGDALSLGVTGSPSIFINGKELQPQALIGFS